MDQYLIYLRKSRADRDAELRGEGDTLGRHRAALLSLAQKMKLTIAGELKEVVSGETIAARPEMQKLLRLVETGAYAGVLVVEVERLARGNTRDQGVVAETFQYSGTKIITLSKTYDPASESDQEYFEFGLFMSRREYKTINRRLQRGRDSSLNEGKYISGSAPYGYERVKLPRQKGYSLKIVPDKAEVVRRIFSLYTRGELQPDGTLRPCGSFTIAKRLDAQGIPSPSGGKWSPSTVKDTIINPTYAGLIRWSYRPTVRTMLDGEVAITRPVNHQMEAKEGLHEPIVQREVWDQAQQILAGRSHAPVPSSVTIKNPLAGLVYCSGCGRSLERRKFLHGQDMLMCPGKDCSTKGSVLSEVERGVLDALRLWLAEYQLDHNGDGNGTATLSELPKDVQDARRAVSRLTATLATLETQRSSLYDLLEQGLYTQELFLSRSKILAEKSNVAESALADAQRTLSGLEKLSEQQTVIIPNIERVLVEYPALTNPKEKNDLLKEVLQKVLYTKTQGSRWLPSNMSIYVLPKTK